MGRKMQKGSILSVDQNNVHPVAEDPCGVGSGMFLCGQYVEYLELSSFPQTLPFWRIQVLVFLPFPSSLSRPLSICEVSSLAWAKHPILVCKPLLFTPAKTSSCLNYTSMSGWSLAHFLRKLPYEHLDITLRSFFSLSSDSLPSQICNCIGCSNSMFRLLNPFCLMVIDLLAPILNTQDCMISNLWFHSRVNRRFCLVLAIKRGKDWLIFPLYCHKIRSQLHPIVALLGWDFG